MMTTAIIKILILTNLARLATGLPALKIDDNLNRAASVRAEQIRTSFKHDLSLVESTNCFWYGENLAKGYSGQPKWIVDAWMKSTTHRSNILSEKYQRIGIAKRGQYTVQIFCGDYKANKKIK